MNYGKENVRKQRRELTSKKVARRKRVGVLVLLGLVAAIFTGIGFGIYKGYTVVEGIIAEAPEITKTDVAPSGFRTTILDADGNVTAELLETGSNRIYVSIDEIPENLQHAFVAIEDERFYEHNGVDVQGILRAAVKGVTSGSFSEGASTITQQLIKNNVFENWTSESSWERVKRKLQEQYLALQLEKEADKDWILENYLNTINLGQNTLGVQAASQRYFGKEVSDLTLSECAVIAAITQNPSKYNPITYPENNRTRREKVLSNMLKDGYITQAEYDEAIADDVYERIDNYNIEVENADDGENITSYFVDSLTDEVLTDLQEELGYSESQAYRALYSGGLTIYSTQDPEIQAVCDQVVNDDTNYEESKKISFSYALSIQQPGGELEHFSEQNLLAYYRQSDPEYTLDYDSQEAAQAAVTNYRTYLLAEGGEIVGENLTFTVQPQASVTLIDQTTGQVKAIVGGRGEKTASRTLNRATDTTEQPGSTFKILTAYAPALDMDSFTLATTLEDEKMTYSDGKVITNADDTYRGDVTIREAIQESINTVAVQVSRKISVNKGYSMAEKFGITTLRNSDKVEALPLGGITDGVTNLELTAAYAAIANGGTYTEPVMYTKIVDQSGEVLLNKTPETRRVIQKSTAYLLTSAMEDVISDGTGTEAYFDGMSIAGKTGTTSNNRAIWMEGYSPYYTCGVWGGYDDNSTLTDTTYAKHIWKGIMSQLSADEEDVGFTVPSDVKKVSLCTQSGLVARANNCVSTTSEYYRVGTAPTKMCGRHQTAKICKESGKLATEYCPDEDVITKSYATESTGAAPPSESCTIHTKEWAAKKAAEEAAKKAAEEAAKKAEEEAKKQSSTTSTTTNTTTTTQTAQ